MPPRRLRERRDETATAACARGTVPRISGSIRIVRMHLCVAYSYWYCSSLPRNKKLSEGACGLLPRNKKLPEGGCGLREIIN